MSEQPAQRPERSGGAKRMTLPMIVTALIVGAFLFGVLIGGARHAREAARRSSCLSILRSIHLSCYLYADDSKGAFPFAANADDSNDHFYLLFPNYITSTRPFICPSDESCRHHAADITKAAFDAPNVNSYAYVAGLKKTNSPDLPLLGDNILDRSWGKGEDPVHYINRTACSQGGGNHGSDGGFIMLVNGYRFFSRGLPVCPWESVTDGAATIKNPNGIVDKK